jgi:hypothetical protein
MSSHPMTYESAGLVKHLYFGGCHGTVTTFESFSQ